MIWKGYGIGKKDGKEIIISEKHLVLLYLTS
jgi:hypothetical protein